MTPTIICRVPTFDEYHDLCVAVGWEHAINFAIAPQSLSNSLFGVVVEVDHQIIGMGRIVGDGAMYFYLQDIVVKPIMQGQGVGKLIVKALLEYIRSHAKGPVFVGLFATEQARYLYESYGFTSGDMQGMFQVITGNSFSS